MAEDSKKETAKEVKPVIKTSGEIISKAEYEKRIKLCVSNPNYINPSLDHYIIG